MDRFRMPTGESDEDLRTKLRAFADAIDELALADEFAALGHEDDTAALRQMATDFHESEGEQGTALASQVGATRVIPEILRDGRSAVKTLNAIFSNVFRSDVEKLAAWKSASHLERDGSPTDEEPATPPVPPVGIPA